MSDLLNRVGEYVDVQKDYWKRLIHEGLTEVLDEEDWRELEELRRDRKKRRQAIYRGFCFYIYCVIGFISSVVAIEILWILLNP